MSDPSLQPDREAQIRQIMDYLEQHRDQYDLKALRSQLLDNGYPNTVVDESMRRLDGGKTSAGLRGPRAIGCGLAMGNYIAISLLVGMLATILNGGYEILAAPVIVLGAELLAAAAMWNSERRKNLSRIMLWAVLWTLIIAVALVALGALLFGICIALIGAPSFQ